MLKEQHEKKHAPLDKRKRRHARLKERQLGKKHMKTMKQEPKRSMEKKLKMDIMMKKLTKMEPLLLVRKRWLMARQLSNPMPKLKSLRKKAKRKINRKINQKKINLQRNSISQKKAKPCSTKPRQNQIKKRKSWKPQKKIQHLSTMMDMVIKMMSIMMKNKKE
jgi:hypothetical protein